MENFDYIVEYDKLKTKVLKYILYKKRTENEVRRKFSSCIDIEILDEIIEELIENGYIDDDSYIDRTIKEYMSLKSMSMKEVKYKLLSKGLNNDDVENYFSIHYEELVNYEIQSAKNIIIKKQNIVNLDEIKQILLKKGYKLDNVREALELI